MERNLEKTMDDMIENEGVVGCVLADKTGLCLGAKGVASNESAGIITAIAQHVAKLEPGSPVPIIHLSNETRQCLIHNKGPVIGAIYKDSTA